MVSHLSTKESQSWAVRVKRLRTRMGMNQTQFAAHFGINIVTVSRWENAHYEPTPVLRHMILNAERPHRKAYEP